MDGSSASPVDWSALWSSSVFEAPAETNTKGFSDTMDYNIPLLGSEFDFTSQMAIDPHALHFDNLDTHKFGLDDFSLSNDLTPNQYSFTFQPDVDMSTSNQPFGRRLSVTSSSSSSGASLSPMIEAQPASESIAPASAAEELAQRVRQSAGVMLAVPMDARMQQTNGRFASLLQTFSTH